MFGSQHSVKRNLFGNLFGFVLLSLFLVACNKPNEGAGKKDPQKYWGVYIGERIQSLPAVSVDGNVYFGSSNSYLYAFRPNGRFLWKVKADGQVLSPHVSEDGKVVAVTTDKGHLLVVDDYGKLLWEKKEEQHKRKKLFGCPPAFSKNGILFTGGDLVLISYHIATGKPFVLGSKLPAVRSCPAVDSQNRLYYSNSNFLFVWDIAQQKQLQKIAVQGYSSAPEFTKDGGFLVSSNDATSTHVLKFSKEGKLLWKFAAPNVEKEKGYVYQFEKPQISPNGDILVNQMSVGLFALDAKTGVQKWFLGKPSIIPYHNYKGRLAFNNQGIVFATSGDGKLYAISPQGKILYSFATRRRTLFGAAISKDQKYVYFGSFDKHFYAIYADKMR